ncbi:MAG: 5'-nucleotidase C-terminal domain-containing protein [Acetivibrio ethanolgignens]
MNKKLTKQLLSLVLAMAMVFSGLMIPAKAEAASATTKISIIHTNDTHGRLLDSDERGASWGFAKIATLVKETKAANPNTLVLDAGDAFQGMPIINISKGKGLIPILEAVGYDAMTMGNHEFDFGLAALQDLEKSMTKIPMVTANIYKTTGGRAFVPYTIKTVGGVKVGIFGLTTPETTYKSHPDNTKGLTFMDPVKSAKSIVKELEAQVDIIICLSHLGTEGEDTSFKVAENVKGIDLIIDGHSHTELPFGVIEVNGTMIAQTGEYTKNVGMVELEIADKKIVKKSAVLLADNENVKEDEAVKTLIEKLKKENEPLFAQVVGETAVELDGVRENVRTKETNLGNLSTDALRVMTGADCAVQNGGGIRASIKAGNITKLDMATVFPFGNTVEVREMTGEAILKALEHSVSVYPDANGGFLQVSGITFKFNPEKEAGSRVVSVKINGKDLSLTKKYTVAMNNFTAAGGDGYEMFVGTKKVAELGTLEEVLVQYFQKNGTKGCEVSGRITTVTGKDAQPKLSLTKKVSSLKVTKSYTFEAEMKNVVAPEKITWSVDKKDIASISKTTGKLTAKKAGKVKVTATCGKYKTTVTVKITK